MDRPHTLSRPEVSPPQEIFVSPRGDNAGQQITHLGLRPSGIEWSADGKMLLFIADSAYRDERKYGSPRWKSPPLRQKAARRRLVSL